MAKSYSMAYVLKCLGLGFESLFEMLSPRRPPLLLLLFLLLPSRLRPLRAAEQPPGAATNTNAAGPLQPSTEHLLLRTVIIRALAC